MDPADRKKYAAFLPPVFYGPPKPTPKPPHGSRHAAPKPPSAAVLKNQARNVGQYAFDKLVIIGEEYAKNAGEWRSAFADVLAAYALAITRMDTTLKDAEREAEREAAWASLIVSLFTAGAMRFLGAYVQYSFLPKVFSGKQKLVPEITLTPSIAPNFRPITVGEISKLYAAAFGGIAQDLGNRLIPRLAEAATAGSQDLNTLGGLEVMRSKFTKLIEEATGLVVSDLSAAKNWMIDHDEFGSEWIAYSGGSEDAARNAIRDQLNKNRVEWGKSWQIYGRKPSAINQELLARHYERGLWIGYIAAILYGRWRVVSVEDHIAEVRRRGEGGKAKVGVRVQSAIIERLEELNVVQGETYGELYEQAQRIGRGEAPTPRSAGQRQARYARGVRLDEGVGRYGASAPQSGRRAPFFSGVETSRFRPALNRPRDMEPDRAVLGRQCGSVRLQWSPRPA